MPNDTIHSNRGEPQHTKRAALFAVTLLLAIAACMFLASSAMVQASDGSMAEAIEEFAAEGLVNEEVESLGTDGVLQEADTLNENTCAVIQCHPMLNDVPITSRHGKIQCVACHTQRRAHTEQCVSCHEVIRGHTEETSSMDQLRQEMQDLRENDPMMGASEVEGTLPEPLDCLVCHLKMKARPVTFPQIVPSEHIPEDQSKKNCVDCHRAHDPKPRMGHPMPLPYCRRGRDCCLSCHLKIPELTSQDRVTRPATNPSGVLIPPVPLRESGWAEDTFVDWVLEPPLVAADHGHGTVECISCHGVPPSFHDLAKKVHNFELESVRCGKCHTGSTIIDQQVLLSESAEFPPTEVPHH